MRLRIILAFHIALIYYNQDFRVYEGTRDQPMPGPFPAPPIFLREKPWGRGCEIPLEKKLSTVSSHFPLHAVEEVMEYLGLKHPIIFDVYSLCHNYHSNKLSSFNVSVERHVRVFRNTLQIYRSKKRPFSQGFSVKECH